MVAVPDLIFETQELTFAAGFMVLPAGWIGVIGMPRWEKPYGWFNREFQIIEVHAPAWMPKFLRDYFNRITWEHEARHAWGNPGCGHVWCLGYEGPKWAEYLAMPVQLVAGLRFCKQCRTYGP